MIRTKAVIEVKTVIEVKVGERIYSMECGSDSPLGEVHDALVQMKSIVIGMMQTHQDQEEKEEQDDED